MDRYGVPAKVLNIFATSHIFQFFSRQYKVCTVHTGISPCGMACGRENIIWCLTFPHWYSWHLITVHGHCSVHIIGLLYFILTHGKPKIRDKFLQIWPKNFNILGLITFTFICRLSTFEKLVLYSEKEKNVRT